MLGRRQSQAGLEVAGHDHPEVIPQHSYHTPSPPAAGNASDYRPGSFSPLAGEHHLARKPVPSQISREDTDKASPPTRRNNRRRRKWIIIGVLAVVMIAAVVGGVVGGITASKKKNEDSASKPAAGSTSSGENSSSSSSSASPSPTAVEPESSPTSSSLANPLRWPKGLQYVAQINDQLQKDGDYNWTNFDASYFYRVPPIPDSLTPSTTCLTNWDVDGTSNDAILYKHGSPISGANITIQQRGYLYSKDGGKYTVTLPGTNDNIILFWFGAAAVSDYTRANANAVVPLTGPGAADTGKSFDISLNPGEVVPVRFMWSNSLGPGVLRIEVTDPRSNSCFCNNGGRAADCFYSNVYSGSSYTFKPFGQE